MHARDIRVRVAEKRPTVVVRVERREQGRQGRPVRSHQEPEEGQPQAQDPAGSR